jgi:PAS domain S-box-containing protein
MKPKNNEYAVEGKFVIPLELIADLTVFSNDQRNIVEASESFEKICGLKREELIGKKAFELFLPKGHSGSVAKKHFLKIVDV